MTLALFLLAIGVSICCVVLYCKNAKGQREIEQLCMRLKELQHVLHLRGDLANEVAHELKNPLTAILCSAETLDLLIGPRLDDMHRRSLRYIKEYGDHLLRLVSDFLEVSRAEAGYIEPRPESVNVAAILESVTGLLESSAMRKHINLRRTVSDAGLLAYADPKHMKQVVFNLVHNAIKFTPEYGEIEVGVRRDFPQPGIIISVRDNGSGVSAEEIPSVFDPYVAFRTGRENRDVGMGLGLALCKNLIELAGGKIAVRSEVGVGSLFEITVPEFTQSSEHVASNSRVSRETQIIEGSLPLAGKNVLLIDSDEGSRESIASLIEAWGAIVDKTSDVDDALAAIERKAYHVVMVDEEVNHIEPNELTRMLRENLSGSETTVILTSAGDGKEASNTKGLAQGAKSELSPGTDCKLQKPINGETLLTSLLGPNRFDVTH